VLFLDSLDLRYTFPSIHVLLSRCGCLTSRKRLAGKSVNNLKVTMSCSTVTCVNCMSTRLSPDDSSNEIRCNYCTLESLTQRLFPKLLFLLLPGMMLSVVIVLKLARAQCRKTRKAQGIHNSHCSKDDRPGVSLVQKNSCNPETYIDAFCPYMQAAASKSTTTGDSLWQRNTTL